MFRDNYLGNQVISKPVNDDLGINDKKANNHEPSSFLSTSHIIDDVPSSTVPISNPTPTPTLKQMRSEKITDQFLDNYLDELSDDEGGEIGGGLSAGPALYGQLNPEDGVIRDSDNNNNNNNNPNNKEDNNESLITEYPTSATVVGDDHIQDNHTTTISAIANNISFDYDDDFDA